jgi:hypothetical protein
MRGGALLAALALIAAPAAAQEPEPEQGRVWKGTMGDQVITACFNEEFTRDGIYYRDDAREPLRLVEIKETDPPTFTEMTGRSDETGAVWAMQAPPGDRLTGVWSKGGEVRQISLTASTVTLPEYGTACETGAFLDPLLHGGTVTSRRESFTGTAYTVLEYAGPARMGLEDYSITALALDPAQPGDAAINRALAAFLPDGTAAHRMGQCVGLSLSGGFSGYAEEALVPMALTPRWLGLRYAGTGYCGGAHPNHFDTMAVHDRRSGGEVDPSTWFKPGALGFYEWESEIEPKPVKRLVRAPSAGLWKAIAAHWPLRDAESGCGPPEEPFDSGWEIGLTREGPVFVPQLPFVIFACTEEIVLPWKAARPFLSPEGRAVMKSLR